MVSPAKCIAGRSVADWIAAYPVVSDLCALKETAWTNPDKLPFAQAAAACPLTLSDIEDAAARLERFAPYLPPSFPRLLRPAASSSPLFSHPPDAEGAEGAQRHPHRRAGMGQVGQSSAISGSIKRGAAFTRC